MLIYLRNAIRKNQGWSVMEIKLDTKYNNLYYKIVILLFKNVKKIRRKYSENSVWIFLYLSVLLNCFSKTETGKNLCISGKIL